MVISFCGKNHVYTPYDLLFRIEHLLSDKIRKDAKQKFLVCDNDKFYYYIYGVLMEFKKRYEQIEIILVTTDSSYLFKEETPKKYYDSFVLLSSEGLSEEENQLKLYKWMIDNSDFTVFSATEETVSEHNALQYAEKVNKENINLL